MKILLLSIIVLSFVLILVLPQPVFAKQSECEKMDINNRYNTSVLSFNEITSFLNHTATQFSWDLNSNYTKTTLIDYNGTKLITMQTLNKTEYNFGEYIHVYPELTNIGNKSVYVTHYFSPFFVVVNYQNGSSVFKDQSKPGVEVMPIPEFPTLETNNLEAGKSMTISNSAMFPPLTQYLTFGVNKPGSYTVSTVSDLFYDVNDTCNRIFLWSKPTQITVGTSNVPEFPFSIPVLLISILSVIVIYRIKLENKKLRKEF